MTLARADVERRMATDALFNGLITNREHQLIESNEMVYFRNPNWQRQ
jgi:hypothetical protein